MAEKAINENADKQRDYITFLKQLIKVCIIFKEKINLGYKKIFFREKGGEDHWYEAQKEGWSNCLSCCVYDSIVSGTRALEISQSDDTVSAEAIYLDAELNITPDKMANIEDENSAEKKMNRILEELQDEFASSRITDRLKKDGNLFFSFRKELLKKKSVFHIKKSEIKTYLEKYYKLLVDCTIFYNDFRQNNVRNDLIGVLLHLDSVFDEERKAYRLNFWSPIAMNKLQKVNEGIEIFFRQITENKAVESRWMQEVYKQTLLTKAQHNFRWYISGPNQELLHAAIAPYVDNKSNDLKFQITARSMKKYNSYEGIGELRLGEKILYEYELIRKERSLPKFSVAIMGDIHARPVEELYHYVNKKIGEFSGKTLIEFNVYTKNRLDQLANDHIIYRGYPSEALLKKEELSGVIDTNNLVFILDCIELYKSPMAEKENLDFIMQKYAFSAYDEYNTRIMENTDICDYNMLEELYEIMTCEQCFNQFGMLSKEAYGSLLEFCEEKQKERGRESVIYVYVSDMKAFHNIYNDDQYYIRTERYNQKEIGIIRYSSEKVTKLKISNKDKMLVFNMWQFIKNVAINEKNMFASQVNKSEDAYMDMDKIHIGIDYTNWPDLLVVHYYCEEKRYDQVAVNFIKDVLLPVFNNRSRNMFHTYIRKAMYSFFYSSAKTVNDMLFIHLFKDKENLLGKAVLAKENNEEKVKRNRNKEFKYSSKRFYDMIMKNYDISSNIYVGQMRTSHIIQKNERTDAKIDKNEIYKNVITACKNLSYENAYLAKNCERELN